MIIECPYCRTRFRLDEKGLGDRRPTLRCSQCRRTFPLPPPPETEDDVGDLSFAYDDDTEWSDSGNGNTAAPTNPSEEQFTLPTRRKQVAEDDDVLQTSLFDPVVVEDETDESEEEWFDEPSPRPAPPDGDDDARYDDSYDDPDFEERVTPTFRIRPLLVFLGLVVTGYGILAWTLRSNPDWASSIVRQVPIVGGVLKANELSREIELHGLRGRYERTKEGTLIFLITGSARNQHDEPVRDIRIDFKLLDGGGAVVAEQSTTCGSAMRPELVRDLTVQQVAILRGWGTNKPPSESNVPPGKECPLLSIFLGIPETVHDFTGEVVQARINGR